MAEVALIVAAVVVTAVTALRWLRVAQREHYLAPAVSRFAIRWWLSTTLNQVLAVVAVTTVVVSLFQPAWGWLALTALLYGPWGLGLRGATSRLAWTDRLWRLAVAAGIVVIAVAVLAGVSGMPGWAVAACLVLPAIIDGALFIIGPFERRLGEPWVEKAQARLVATGARVVGITGSYGKTTTKTYLAHLLSGWRRTVMSPASFNNRMGLARAINENLVPGTEIFIAEMGTYGPGEIADLCRFVRPDVAMITAIGPVHLERFGSLEAIVAAKREILQPASIAILNVDHESLHTMAVEEADRRRVVTVSSTGRQAMVAAVDGVLWVGATKVGFIDEGSFASNLALAAAAALELGLPPDELTRRLEGVPDPPHRRELSTSELGFAIVDDTYNSNPAGALAALEELAVLAPEGRRVVVSPGMVELGGEQYRHNLAFASAASRIATDVVVVGRTNRRALLDGARQGPASVTVMPSRQAAVAWVRDHLGPGDAVLYENDLPDHYP